LLYNAIFVFIHNCLGQSPSQADPTKVI